MRFAILFFSYFTIPYTLSTEFVFSALTTNLDVVPFWQVIKVISVLLSSERNGSKSSGSTVVISVILGIQFMMGSVEEKAKIKDSLIPFVIGCIVDCIVMYNSS